MDLFTIHNAQPFEAVNSVGNYTSLIWTERYSTNGDFELVTPDIEKTLAKIPRGSILGITQSDYLMMVDDFKIKKDDSGSYSMTVKGRSLDTFLENRAARTTGQTSEGDWTFTGVYPIATAISVVNGIITNGVPNTNDKIAGGKMGVGTNIVETVSSTLTIQARDLYSALREIISSGKYGVIPKRFVSGGEMLLKLDIIAGVDRSIEQSVVPPVIFHVSNGDIVDASYLFDEKSFKNVAYVYSKTGSRIVYAPGFDSTISSFDRRGIYINAGDIESPTDASMDERGNQELAIRGNKVLFDGKVNPISTTYLAPRDYYLGDIVTLIAEYGVRQPMRIEEVIRVSDNEGERVYPTLVTN